MLPTLRQQAIDNYWRQREKELSYLPNFKREVMIKKEQQEVKQGLRQLPPEIFQNLPSQEKAPAPSSTKAPIKAIPPPKIQPSTLATTTTNSSSGVFLPPPPPPL